MEIWACHEKYLVSYLQKKANLSSEDYKSIALFQMPVMGENRILSTEGNTATIEITGVLNKNGPSRFAMMFGYGGTGYTEIIEAVETVINDESIENVNFEIDSPGGRVTGVDEAYQAIADLAKVKNVTMINTGMIASGAYWLAAAATPILSTSAVNETGSIGVVVVGYDWTEQDKKYGLKEVVILSKNAENKYAGVDTKEGIKEIQREVDAIERVFLDRVAKGRNKDVKEVIANFGKGGILIADDPGDEPDAISVGMIDGLTKKAQLTSSTENNKNSLNINPADAENNNSEGSMDLKEAIDKHPAIDAQVKLKVQDAVAAALENSKSINTAMIAKVAIVFDEKKSYPQSCINVAIDVLQEKEVLSTLSAVMAVHDMAVEKEKADAALLESKGSGGDDGKGGETHQVQNDTKISEDGSVNSEADFQANIVRMKKES